MSLREVNTSEKTFMLASVMKKKIHFWEENVNGEVSEMVAKFKGEISNLSVELLEIEIR